MNPPTGRPAGWAAETLFHSEPWRQAVEQSFDVKILAFRPAAERTGIAWYSPLSDIRGERVVATRSATSAILCSTPPRGGPSSPTTSARSSDRSPCGRSPTTLALADRSFEQRRELVWHGVDLTGGADRVWDGLKTKLRTTIRRAPKTGLRLRFSGSLDDLATFHAMHVDCARPSTACWPSRCGSSRSSTAGSATT